LIPFQNFRPVPTPSRCHGWFCAGGFATLFVFTVAGRTKQDKLCS
jgi:hypothetical protein